MRPFRICHLVRQQRMRTAKPSTIRNEPFINKTEPVNQIVISPIGQRLHSYQGAYASTINVLTLDPESYDKPYFDGSQVAYTVAQI